VLQIALDTQTLGAPYEEVLLAPNQEIRPDMFVDRNETYIYVMAETKVRESTIVIHLYHGRDRDRGDYCCNVPGVDLVSGGKLINL